MAYTRFNTVAAVESDEQSATPKPATLKPATLKLAGMWLFFPLSIFISAHAAIHLWYTHKITPQDHSSLLDLLLHLKIFFLQGDWVKIFVDPKTIHTCSSSLMIYTASRLLITVSDRDL